MSPKLTSRGVLALLLISALLAGVTVVLSHLGRENQLYDLLAAAGSGDDEQVATLIKAGAPVTGSFGGDGDTPLHRAAAAGATSVVRQLLANGADVNALNDQGSSPLLYAVFHGNFESAAELLHFGADPNIAESRFGSTPLMDAARHGRLNMVVLLLEQGAVPTTTDKSGETALDKANRKGHLDVVAAIAERSSSAARSHEPASRR